MGHAQLLADAGIVVIHVTFAVCVLYPATGLYWPWWKSSIGLSVIAKTTAIGLLLLPSELRLFFGWNVTSQSYGWFRLACFAAVPLILIWRAVAIYLVQRRGAAEG